MDEATEEEYIRPSVLFQAQPNIQGRVKDIFALCYLSEYVDGEKLMRCIHTYILDDPDMFENDMNDIRQRIKKIFTDRDFTKSVEESGKYNWLRIKASVAFERILECLEGLN